MRSRTVKQCIRVDCYLDLYEDISLVDMLTKVNKTIENTKWYSDWLEADINDDAIHLFGEVEEDVYFTPGSPATWLDPPEPDEFDGMIEQDEIEHDIKDMLGKVNLMQYINDIDFEDMYVDTEEDLYWKMYDEPDYEPDEDYYRGC